MTGFSEGLERKLFFWPVSRDTLEKLEAFERLMAQEWISLWFSELKLLKLWNCLDSVRKKKWNLGPRRSRTQSDQIHFFLSYRIRLFPSFMLLLVHETIGQIDFWCQKIVKKPSFFHKFHYAESFPQNWTTISCPLRTSYNVQKVG